MLSINTILRASEFTHQVFPQRIKRTILVRCLRIIESIIGQELYITFDDKLPFPTDNPLALVEPLAVATALVRDGWVGSITKNERVYPDEMYLHSFRISGTSERWGSGHGVDFSDEKKALWRAVGEYTERAVWRHHPFYERQMMVATVAEMPSNTLDLNSLAGFDRSLIEIHPVLSYGPDTSFTWTKMYTLDTPRQDQWVPVQLISSLFARTNVRHPALTAAQCAEREPMLRWCVTTGLASGGNEQDALVVGMLEIIERDAFMITHLNQITPKQMDLAHLAAQDAEIADVIATFTRLHITPHILALPTDFNVHVTAVVLTDTTPGSPALCVAASADLDLRSSILDALSEAAAVRLFLRHTIERHGLTAPQQIDQEGRLLYWADPAHAPQLNYLIAGTPETVDLPAGARTGSTKKTHRYSRHDLTYLRGEFKRNKQPVYYMNITPSSISQHGMQVVNVLAPQMHPLHLDETLPYLSSPRLQQLPAKLGIPTSGNINTDPHPFP